MDFKALDVAELKDGGSTATMDAYGGGTEFLIKIFDSQGRMLDVPC